MVGVAIAVVYVATVGATVAFRDGHVRPLYDGFAPPSAYRFVDPPAFFAPGNIEPTPVTTTVALDARGSKAAGIATPDGQFVTSLGRGAIAPAPNATVVSVHITPLDPKSLPRLPDGLFPAGNAYRLEMSYEPSGAAVAHLATPGSLLMELPEIAQHLFVSTDGKKWSALSAQILQPRQLSLRATLNGPGYYVVGTNQPELAAPAKRASHAAVVLGVAAAALAALLFLGAYLVARRRTRSHR